jgi:hypothetical protein
VVGQPSRDAPRGGFLLSIPYRRQLFGAVLQFADKVACVREVNGDPQRRVEQQLRRGAGVPTGAGWLPSAGSGGLCDCNRWGGGGSRTTEPPQRGDYKISEQSDHRNRPRSNFDSPSPRK